MITNESIWDLSQMMPCPIHDPKDSWSDFLMKIKLVDISYKYYRDLKFFF